MHRPWGRLLSLSIFIYMDSFFIRGTIAQVTRGGRGGRQVWNGHQLEQMSSILWCFWEINAVKHLKYSHRCRLFHSLWKSRSNCRCLKELIFHVRSWQWTSGSLRRYNESSSVIPLTSASQSESTLWIHDLYCCFKMNSSHSLVFMVQQAWPGSRS